MINTIFYFPSSLAQYLADSANINARTIAFIPPSAGETTGSIYKNGIRYGMATDDDIKNAVSRIFGNDLNRALIPIATYEATGAIKAGKGLTVNGSGTLKVDFSNLENNEQIDGLDDQVAYILDHDIDCHASKSKYGAIKVGKGLGITDGVLRVDTSDLTEQELAALKGPQGDPGRDGADGANGAPGAAGVGIRSILKTGSNGLIDTYTISLTDNNTSIFTVTNGANGTNGLDGRNGTNGQDGRNGTDGRGIQSINKTGTNGLVDTYTIQYTDNSTPGVFTVTNGRNGVDGGSANVNAELEKAYFQDATGQADQGTQLKIALNKNDGSQEDPDVWCIDDITIGSATTTKAGLMSAADKTKLNGIESGAQAHVAPTTAEVKSALGTGSGTTKYLREDGTWATPAAQVLADWNQSNNSKVDYIKNKPTTMGASGSNHKGGLVPDTPSTAGTSKFLREDGTWSTPSGVTLDSVLSDSSTNGILNKTVAEAINALLSRLDKLEDWVEDHKDLDYDSILEDVITAFNTTLSDISGAPLIKTSSNNGNETLRTYLNEYYTAAKNVFSASSSPLFDSETYPEAVVDVEGLRGDNTSLRELTFKAMSSWLFAMCLSELMPSSGTSTNNQTKFFKTAWDFADGDTTPIYGDYDVHADPMIGRIAAGAVYAYIRGKKSYSDINTLRTGLEGNFTAIGVSTDFGSLAYADRQDNPIIKALGFTDVDNDTSTNIGYLVNTGAILPVAPGPFANDLNYNANREVPYGTDKQPESLFYTTVPSGKGNWYLHNYKVDVAVDEEIRTVYNFTSADKEKREMLVYGAAISWATAPAFFGHKRVKKTGTAGNGYYTFVETSESTEGSDVYEITGPFAAYENKTINSYATSSTDSSITQATVFLRNVANIADDCRFPTFFPQLGRRRPLGGESSGSARYQDNTKNDRGRSNPLNGVTFGDVVSLFADKASQLVKWGTTDKSDAEYDFPHDKAKSYPSGHTALAFTIALMLGQMRASNLSNYTEVANLIKNAYKFSTARSVNRFHWNSDLIYGRLFSTFILPIINAMSSVQTPYDEAKGIINGSSTPSQGSATVSYNSYYEGGGDSDVTVNIINDTSDSITLGITENNTCRAVTLITQGDHLVVFTIPNQITLAANGGNTSITSSAGSAYYNSNFGSSWNFDTAVNITVDASVNANQLLSIPLGNLFSGEQFKAGSTYDIHITSLDYVNVSGTGTGTVTEGSSGSGSVSTTKLKLIINNNSGSTLTAANQLNFLVTDNNSTVKVGCITLDNSISIADDGTGTYIGTLSSSSYVGNSFSSTYVADGDDFGSNIILYDVNDSTTALYNLNLPAINPSDAASGFQPGATYTINYGGGSSPNPGPSGSVSEGTVTLNIVNNSNITFSDDINSSHTFYDTDSQQNITISPTELSSYLKIYVDGAENPVSIILSAKDNSLASEVSNITNPTCRFTACGYNLAATNGTKNNITNVHWKLASDDTNDYISSAGRSIINNTNGKYNTFYFYGNGAGTYSTKDTGIRVAVTGESGMFKNGGTYTVTITNA